MLQPTFEVGTDRGNRGFGAQLSISGARPQENNYRLDGVSINDYGNGGPGSVLGGNLGVDSIQEFSVLTSNYSAEYGKTSGGVVNAITRSGTNQFHGSAYEGSAANRPADGGAGLTVQGLPIFKPPDGTLSAINLDRGEIMWQVPHGDTPDSVRNHPALKGLNIPKTGQPGTSGVGLMVTKTLVVMGDSQITTTPQHPRGAMLRAYDKATGNQVGAVYMPAPQSGSPMTYMWQGKQYIVVAVGGGNYSGEYIAFTLPATEEGSPSAC
jgi:hypothetical protein